IASNGVEESTRTLTLEAPLTAGLFAVDADNTRNTRVRRWDQSGKVRDENGNELLDLDATGAPGDIQIPGAGTFVVLENGIAVAFDLDAAGGRFRSGDYWMIAARTANASIERLDHAPPVGIHAHYAKLAIVTFPDTEINCPTLWPPEAGDACCDCTVCVTPDSHASGSLTLQAAVEKARETGGTVCVAAGTYVLAGPLRIPQAGSLRVRGQGWSTQLVMPAGAEAIHVETAVDVALENLAVISRSIREPGATVTVRNGIAVALRHLLVVSSATSEVRGVAISLS